uniref:CRAL-TRIO domain-containing protein n=1 Tax=Aegilops tauschii subsp. strangulata TaxID=200361 RepID=A0A453SFU0_AEGTS
MLSVVGLQILTAISAVDELNYPEKAETYYIVNAPYIFSACWKVVKPLLQERTRKKVHVLSGRGKDELLKIMDHLSIPHFCRREGSSKASLSSVDDCFSLDHPFHQELYHYIEQQALNQELIKQGSLHVDIPDQDPDDAMIVEVIQAEFHKLGEQNGSADGDHK